MSGRTIPYELNPARRVRRLYRWLEACGGAPHCSIYLAGNGYDETYESRASRCNELLGAEIEWACWFVERAIGGAQ